MGNNIKVDLRELGHKIVEWVQLAQNRVQWLVIVNTVMKFLGFHKKGEFLD
jgi:hypothetical protein